MAEENKKRIVILGAGLAGAYAAILFGRKGYEVDVYERRPDTRGKGGYEGRSINLALSYRGRTALAKAGLEEEIVKSCVPMKGRLMHDTDGKRSYMQYGQDDQAILSVSRQLLNEKLIDKAEEYPNVRFHFQVSCKAVNPSNHAESLVMVDEREDGEEHFVGEEESFAKRGKTFSRGADLVIGADGIYSNVRKALQRIKGINFSQMYLDHGYKELVIPPAANGDYAMNPHNALHIWPRGDFMMIALPNPDKSYTVTLFMPWVKFNAIKNVEDVRQFFQATFPDSIPLMPTLEHDFFANPTCHLCTVRLNPWHHKEFVVVGDAAHAVVPFFGQGMNASLEDVNILDELVTKHEGNFDLALEEFSATRPKDGNAVSDLSLRNYIEMRSEVAHSTFLWRARFERWIERYPRLSEWVLRLPWKKGDSNDPTGGFHPKYSMVSFSDIPYTELIRRNEIQTQRLDFLLYRVLPFSVVVGGAIAVPGVRRFILQVVDNITSGFKK